MQKSKLWTQNFFGASFSSFFQYMTHYAFVATLPVFVIETLRGDAGQAGLVMTVFQIGAILCRPLAGSWMDHFNKRMVMLISLLVFLAVSFLYLGSPISFLLLLFVRLMHGMVFATGTTAVATVAALIIPEGRKGEGIGYFAMFTNLAMVVGPFMSLLLINQVSFYALFAVCILLALLSLLCAYIIKVPQVIQKEKKQAQEFHWNTLLERKALPMAVSAGLLFIAYSGILVFIPLYAKNLGFGEYASAFFAVYATVIVMSRPIIGRLFDRFGASFVVYPALAVFGLGMVALSNVETVTGFLVSGAVLGFAFGALSPSFQTLAIQMSPRERAGAATSTYFLFLDIGVGLGSFLLSMIASKNGYHVMYLAAAAVVIIIAAVYYVLYQRKYGKVSQRVS